MKRRQMPLLLAGPFFEDPPAMTPTPDTTDCFEQMSDFGFAQSLQRMTVTFRAAGMQVFARIDHAAAARQAGLSMPQTTVLVCRNPKGDTTLMLASPAAALDLPLRIPIREGDDGHAFIEFHPVIQMRVTAGVAQSLAARLVPSQGSLVHAAQL
jgi:uncharacterized protein (DUF302 family)